jgi:transitional endoplasmic reticulum ATPase
VQARGGGGTMNKRKTELGLKYRFDGTHPCGRLPAGRRTRNFRKLTDIAQLRKLEYLINGLHYAGKIYDDTLFDMAMRYLTVSEKRFIVAQVFERAVRYKIDSERWISHHNDGTESSESTLKGLYTNDRLKNSIFLFIFIFLVRFREKQTTLKLNCPLQKKLNEMSSVFGLNTAEKEILLLLYLVHTDNAVERLFAETNAVTDVKNDFCGSSKGKKTIMVLTGLSRHDVDTVVSEKSTLSRVGLLDSDGNPVSEVIDFLAGTSTSTFSQRYFQEFTGPVVPLEVLAIEKEHVEIVKMLKKHREAGHGTNILLYGEPGTGKTEFARSLGRFLGLSVYEIKNIEEEESDRTDHRFRHRALIACQRVVDPERSIIIVDEADALLNSASAFFFSGPVAEKGQINRILDESKSFIVWITNRYDGIDNSTKRRFDYSIHFEKMTFEQRKSIWETGVNRYHLRRCFTDSDIITLASSYETNAGGIDVALRNAGRIYHQTKKSEKVMPVITALLRAHLQVLDPDLDRRDTKKPDAPEYSVEGLNIHGDLKQVIEILEKFNGNWLHSRDNGNVRNMNVLLYGPPGSGKTEFARFIARHLNRRLIVKKASDLLSCWVGETEKQIRNAFREAEHDRAILFIDEADSFLGSREGATHSWEITSVNEMLTNMETFRGILVCATNFKKVVDSAAIRRFVIKLEFDFLKPEGNMIFYRLFLGRLVSSPLEEEEIKEVKTFSGLTPGDFKVVHQKYSFFNRKEISHRQLIDALRQELEAKDAKYGKVMGFK